LGHVAIVIAVEVEFDRLTIHDLANGVEFVIVRVNIIGENVLRPNEYLGLPIPYAIIGITLIVGTSVVAFRPYQPVKGIVTLRMEQVKWPFHAPEKRSHFCQQYLHLPDPHQTRGQSQDLGQPLHPAIL